MWIHSLVSVCQGSGRLSFGGCRGSVVLGMCIGLVFCEWIGICSWRVPIGGCRLGRDGPCFGYLLSCRRLEGIYGIRFFVLGFQIVLLDHS